MKAKQINPRRVASTIYRRAGCRAGEHVAPSQLAEAAGVTVRPTPHGVSADGLRYSARGQWQIEVHPGLSRGKRERVIGELLAGIALARHGADNDPNVSAVGDELLRRWHAQG
jgi:hypothetical protein